MFLHERYLSLRISVLMALPLLLTSVAPAQRGGAGRARRWQEYTYPTQGFAVSAPAAPNIGPDPQTPEVTVYRWLFGADLRGSIHAGVRSDCAETLARLKKPGTDGAPSAVKDVELNGRHGLETTGETKTGQHYRERIYCAGDRAYDIIGEWGANKTEPLALSRWLNSLRLMEPVAAPAAPAPASVVSKGTLADGHTYSHTLMGLTLELPGSWELKQLEGSHAKSADCRGPFCGNPEVNDELIGGDKTLFVTAWKLSPQLRDRRRYPLERFAKAMISDSIAGSGWQPSGQLGGTRIAGKPAYRLLVHKPENADATGFGIVSENNGYVFLIVGSTGSAADEAVVQKAVEAGRLSPQVP